MENERLTQINAKINLESDEVLYPEADAFAERMIAEELGTLEAFQIKGLYNMTLGLPFKNMLEFLHHQQTEAQRSQKNSKKDLRHYYKELEIYLVQLKSRINGDFNFNAEEEEIELIHNKLVHEFIQHLIAANGEKALAIAQSRQRGRS